MKQVLKYIKWFTLLTLLTVVIVAGSLYRRIDHELLRHVQKQFDNAFPNAVVTIDQASFNGNQGIRLRGLRFATKSPRAITLLESEEVYVDCPVSIKNYLNDDIHPNHIIVKSPTLFLPQNTPLNQIIPLFNALKQTQDPKKQPVPVDFRDAKLVLLDQNSWFSTNRPKIPNAVACSNIQITAAPPGSLPEESNNPESWFIRASVSNHSLKNAQLAAYCKPDLSEWSLSGSVSELEIGNDTKPFLKTFCCPENLTNDFSGTTSFNFQIQKNPELPLGFLSEIQGEIFNGTLAKERTGHPLTDIFIQYSIKNTDIQLRRITGRSDSVLVLAEYHQQGFLSDSPAALRLQLQNVPLQNELVAEFQRFLPPKVARFLNEYEFSCLATVNLNISRTNSKWSPNSLSVTGTSLHVCAQKFPYPLDDLTGNLTLTGTDHLELHLTGTDPARPLQVDGLYTNLTGSPQCETTITAAGYAIDDQLMAALPVSCRTELAALRPHGFVDARISLIKKQEITQPNEIAPVSGIPNPNPNTGTSPMRTEIALHVHDASCCYEKFPYRINGIQGDIRLKNGIWAIEQLQGKCSTAEVHATGVLNNDPIDGEPRFSLRLDAQGLPVDEELYYALSGFPQYELIKKLNARGKVDTNVRIDLRTKTKEVNLEFEARPIPEVSSIRPEIFPYELRNLQGLIVYRKGEMVIENLRGRNGLMMCSGTSRCKFNPDGSWQVDISPLTIDQFHLDHEFQNAVPTSILSAMDQINLNGYFNLSGNLRSSKAVGAPIETVWNMGIVLQQIESRLQIPISNICGRAQVYGQYTEGQPVRIQGELDLDSLCAKNMQITGMTGPFYYDGKNIFFGATSPHPSELVMFRNDFLRAGYEQRMNHKLDEPETQTTQDTNNGIAPAGFTVASPTPQTRMDNGRTAITPVSATDTNTSKRKPLMASTFGGSVWTSGYLAVGTVPSYQISFLLRDAVLGEISRDLNHGDPLPGKATVFANLQGEGRNLATLKGDGGIIVKETALYDQPQILKLFQMLSVSEPDKAAFNASSIDFRVFGKQLRLEHVTLEGPMLSLFGSGWLTLEEHDRLLDLTFNSRLGNPDARIPIVSDVIGGAGDQISQIRVEGPMGDPVIRVERFPGIRKAWWSVFPGTDSENDKNSPSKNTPDKTTPAGNSPVK